VRPCGRARGVAGVGVVYQSGANLSYNIRGLLGAHSNKIVINKSRFGFDVGECTASSIVSRDLLVSGRTTLTQYCSPGSQSS
jgi:hypothetical protein